MSGDLQKFQRENEAWRRPASVCAMWEGAASVAPGALEYEASTGWWPLLAELGVTLLVTREYEHLIIALSAPGGTPRHSWMPVPHPSGITCDARRGVVFLASTRNPNMLYELEPVHAAAARGKTGNRQDAPGILAPVRAVLLPGRLYLHDLAMIGNALHAAAAGVNAIVRFDRGHYNPVWWPASIERAQGPDFSRNGLQLNGIAAGASLDASFFTASAETFGKRYPGDPEFPVDQRGVLFSGASREPIARGLTRPHSPRRRRDGIWVCDSGYGRLAAIRGGNPETVAALPGWTRGLCLHDGIAFVGVSRVLPRFERYAPGLDPAKAKCGIVAVDLRRGIPVAHLFWPEGNQIFNVLTMPEAFTRGFAATRLEDAAALETALFYSMDANRNDTIPETFA